MAVWSDSRWRVTVATRNSRCLGMNNPTFQKVEPTKEARARVTGCNPLLQSNFTGYFDAKTLFESLAKGALRGALILAKMATLPQATRRARPKGT